METSNPFLHLWYRWTPLTAFPLRVNVVYRRYTGYRSILDPAAGILTGQPTNEVTILRPPAQAQRRITPNTPMGIRRSTIINSVNLSNQSGKELIYLKNTICKRAVNNQWKIFRIMCKTHFIHRILYVGKILDTPKNNCNSLLPINCKENYLSPSYVLGRGPYAVVELITTI